MRHPKSLKQALRRLRKDGWTYGELSRLSGLSARTIQRWCNEESAKACQENTKQWYKRRHGHCRKVAKEAYWSNPKKQRTRKKRVVRV